MSFTTDIKNELISINIKSTCCRRALGEGLNFCSVKMDENRSLHIGASDDNIRNFAIKMLGERYKVDIDFDTTFSGTRRADKLKYFDSDKNDIMKPEDRFRCPGCTITFIRGVFIAIGSVSNPVSSYHAELVFRDAVKAKFVYELLSKIGCCPKIVDRANGVGLYYKGSESIEDFLVTIGANNSAFHVINCKIERDIRNAENRATNCVTKNISKAVTAAYKQISDIEKLIASGRFEILPEDIRMTAQLRMAHPDSSLVELASLHLPPISKSGLNHRLAKIAEEASKITDN